MKTYTKQQAWAFVARLFESADKHGFAQYDGRRMPGICSVLADMRVKGLLRLNVMCSMFRATHAEILRTNGPGIGWLAPRNAAGAKIRAAFCRRMARQCKPATKRKGKP